MTYLKLFTDWISTKRTIWILIGTGFIVYFNSLFNGFVWDDEEQVLNNTLIHSISNIAQFFAASTFNTGGAGSLGGLYYKPVMTTFFALIYSLFGPNAFFFHLFQLSVHLVSSVLIFLLFKRLLGEVKINSLLPSFLVALIFLVHPINSETVVYISNLQDILYLFFGILAFYLLTSQKISWTQALLAGLLLLFSTLSKETGFLFVPIIATYLWLFNRRDLTKFIAVFIAALSTYCLLRFALAGIFFRKHGLSPITVLPFLGRLQSLPQIVFYYLKTYFWPANLSINQQWVVKGFNIYDFYLPMVADLGVLGILAGFGVFLHKKIAFFKLYLLFLAWFLVGLGFHLQFFPLDVTITPRWFYLPQLGLLGLLTIFICQLRFKEQVKKLGFLGLVVILIVFSIRVMVRNADFKDGLTLFSHDINYSKDAFDLENNYGVELFRAGKIDEAEIHFKKSTQLSPNWWTNWNNLGTIEWRHGDTALARQYYQKAIDNGQYFMAYENMSQLLLVKDTAQHAKKFAVESLKYLPANAVIWQSLGLAEYKLGNKDKAIGDLQKAYSLAPNDKNLLILQKLQENQPLEF